MRLVWVLVVLVVSFLLVGFLCVDWADNVRKERLEIMLCEITAILNKHNVDYWLAFGTALGQVRENDIIPGDLDGDLAMLQTDATVFVSSGCVEALLCCGYFVERRPAYFRISLDHDFLHVDLQLWSLGDSELTFQTSGMDQPAVFPEDMVLPTQKVIFLGGPMRRVQKPIEFVKHLYGPTWSIPRKFDKGTFNGGYVAWMSVFQPIVSAYGLAFQRLQQGNWKQFKEKNTEHAKQVL